MNADQKMKEHKPKTKPRAPLFGSPWVALFLLLRYEWLQLRPGDK